MNEIFSHGLAIGAGGLLLWALIAIWRSPSPPWDVLAELWDAYHKEWRGFRASDWGVDQALGPDATAVHIVPAAGGQITPASLVYVRPVDGPTPDHAAELVARVADGPGADLSPLVIPLTGAQALRMGLDLIHEHARQCGRRQMKLPGVPDRRPGRGGVTG